MNIILSIITFVVLFVLLGLHLTEFLFGKSKYSKIINLREFYGSTGNYTINIKAIVVLYIISLCYVIGGMNIENNTALSLGLLYSGTILSIYTTYSYWDNIGNLYKLILITLILVFTIYNTHNKSTPDLINNITNIVSGVKGLFM